MKYSIIIPTLNEEKLLPALLQTLSDFKIKSYDKYEIIISDGGSTDGTLEISKKIADKILNYELHDKKNISTGRHKGAVNSSGSTLIFINADIRFQNFETFFDYIEKYFTAGYSAMTCNIKSFPESESLSDKLFSLYINFYVRSLNFLGIGMARGEFQVIRRKTYDSVGGYDINLNAGEDFELSTRLRKKGKILFAKELTVYESPRRYHAWGYLKIISSWFMNSMSSWIFKRSVSKKWEAIR